MKRKELTIAQKLKKAEELRSRSGPRPRHTDEEILDLYLKHGSSTQLLGLWASSAPNSKRAF